MSGVLYDPFGPARGWTRGNATIAVRTYDTDGNVTQIDSAGLGTYAYDDAFRIIGITDTVTPANSYTYDYDLLDRLTSGVKTGTTRGWSYDANGNRLTETGSAASTNNRISSITGALPRTYSYDTAGNVLTYATVTTTYNNRGRMTTLAVGGVTAAYVYNALGQFVKQSGGPSGTVLYVYDEAGHVLGEYNSTGSLIQETIWMGDTPIVTIRPGTPAVVYYVHTDHLDTPRRVTRPSDNLLMWTWYSDPFGADLPNENPAAGGTFKYNLRFPGLLYDSHAGLDQNYYRDYDSLVGRYVESDPIGLCSCPGGKWKQELFDSSFYLALGGFVSVGRVNLTCASRPDTKCGATQLCIGGGPTLGGGMDWNFFGRQYALNSRDLGGWSGWNVVGSIGPFISGSGSVPGPGGNASAGVSAGAGLAFVRCYYAYLRCTCDCEQ